MTTDESICHCCRAKRSQEGKLPRQRIPVTLDGRNPIFLCDYCDGDALRSAKSLESQRLADE